MTIQQIKEDLKEIRYYYSRQRDFDCASRVIGQSTVTEKAERYNAAVRKAPAVLYDLYVSLYVNNNTQLVVSLDWDCSPDYIKRMNNKLCAFLSKELNTAD